MTRKRPMAVLVMGILNIVGGCLSLLCGVAAAGSQVPAGVGLATAPENPMPTLPPGMFAQVRWIVEVEVARGLAVVFLGVLLLTAGIGLLLMGGWARWLSVVTAVLFIVVCVGYVIFELWTV